MNSNWFISRTVRQARQMRKHVWKILSAQRDVLSDKAVTAVSEAMARLDAVARAPLDKKKVRAEMERLEEVANTWLKPYPHHSLRENIEVLLVAIAVAMGIRTFFLQPFKIPTGSMQPTLYGITSDPDFKRVAMPPDALKPDQDFEIPNPIARFVTFWIHGVSYTRVVSGSDGPVTEVRRPQKFLLFNLWQRFKIGDTWHVIWFPVDDLMERAGVLTRYGLNRKVFKKGEEVFKIKVFSGDHLFVDRLTYNFRRPTLGEIIVFETRGIRELPQDQFYIKRLVAVGPTEVRIGDDRHLVLNGRRLDNTTPHFEKVYSFDPQRSPADSQYSGHLNNQWLPSIAPLFPDGNAAYSVPPEHYMVMGDNTMNSSDSRRWGEFPASNVIGKSWLVYWPFGKQDGRDSRFGWGVR